MIGEFFPKKQNGDPSGIGLYSKTGKKEVTKSKIRPSLGSRSGYIPRKLIVNDLSRFELRSLKVGQLDYAGGLGPEGRRQSE